MAHEIYHHKQRLAGKRMNQAKADAFSLQAVRRLGLLAGDPKETISRGQCQKAMREDLKKHGWVWDAEAHCYVDDKQRPDLAISASGYISKR